MEKLLAILSDMKPGIDFATEKNLIDGHILDSLTIVRLVGELNDEFDIEITPLDLIPENFCSADAIYGLISRLSDDN